MGLVFFSTRLNSRGRRGRVNPNEGALRGRLQPTLGSISVMKINIEGERDGQYMQTNWKTVFARITEFKGQPMVEARGLWEMHADMMGGPFVSYTRIDTIRHLTVTAEGFVFAPEKKKRPYIRELEAALQTLKIE